MPIVGSAQALPRAVPDRTAKSVRSGPAPPQHRAADPGEGLWRPSPDDRRLLDQLVKAAAAKPNGRLELPRRIKPGSELVRTWKGKTYRVMVMADGFAYDGKTFASLSEIASEITGTRWNGPRFFGLRLERQIGRPPMASESKVASLRHLHPQIHRAWPGAGVQLARCPAGGLRGLHQEPGLTGLEGPAPAL